MLTSLNPRSTLNLLQTGESIENSTQTIPAARPRCSVNGLLRDVPAMRDGRRQLLSNYKNSRGIFSNRQKYGGPLQLQGAK